MRSKRIIAALLCAVIPIGTAVLPTVVPVTLSAEAAAVIDSGTCGKNASWQLDSDGTLTVSGTGDMSSSLDSSPCPWKEYKKEIKTVVIGNGITRVGANNFSSCSNLVSVSFPDTLKGISESAFSSCNSLESVVLPDSLTYIGNFAFALCKGLTDITIPSSVTSIGSLAFSTTKWLDDQTKKSDYVIVNGMLIWAADKEELTIPDQVSKILDNSIWGRSKVKSIVFPDTVTAFGNNSMAECSSLVSVTFPESVVNIGLQTCVNCTALEEIVILNPDCRIYDRANTFTNENGKYSGVIKGYDGSTAEAYAEKYGYSFVSLGQRPPEYSFGDVNGDGMIDAVDASDVLAYYARVSTDQEGGFGKKQQAAADVDMNGFIDSVDASDILSYYAYVSTEGGNVLSLEAYMKNK